MTLDRQSDNGLLLASPTLSNSEQTRSWNSAPPLAFIFIGYPKRTRSRMSKSSVGDTSKIAVSQRAVTNNERAVLTKQVNAGQQMVVAIEPSSRDGGCLAVIMKIRGQDVTLR